MQSKMSNDTADSLENLCRACMTNLETMKRDARNTNHTQYITEKPTGSEEGPTIVELLQSVLPLINVEIGGDLPRSMCVGCIQQLQLTYEFVELFKDSDEKFRKLLKEVYLKEVASCQNELDEYSEEIVSEQDVNEDSKITNFEIEVENLVKTISVQRDTLDMDEDYESRMTNWLEFEDEPEYNNEDDDNGCSAQLDVFDNPYSDASDDGCTKEEASNEQFTKEPTPKRRKDRNQSCINKIISAKLKPKPYKEKLKITKLLTPTQEAQSIACQECETILENQKAWKVHMRGHRLEKLNKGNADIRVAKPKKSYKCEYCNKEFTKVTSLKNHIRIHTGEEPFLCIECGKSFKVASSLHTHMLRHKGEKTIQCPHCPKKFVCSSGLYGHMMVHNKEKPYVCDICGSAFHMAYMLKKHNLYHKGIRNFPCEYCDLRFVTAEKQRRHLRTHTGEKPYRCKYCERAFAQSNDCNKHMKQHLGENIFQCELCPLRFPLVRDLRVHFATHKDDDEETRASNLAAREAEEEKLRIKLGIKE